MFWVLRPWPLPRAAPGHRLRDLNPRQNAGRWRHPWKSPNDDTIGTTFLTVQSPEEMTMSRLGSGLAKGKQRLPLRGGHWLGGPVCHPDHQHWLVRRSQNEHCGSEREDMGQMERFINAGGSSTASGDGARSPAAGGWGGERNHRSVLRDTARGPEFGGSAAVCAFPGRTLPRHRRKQSCRGNACPSLIGLTARGWGELEICGEKFHKRSYKFND